MKKTSFIVGMVLVAMIAASLPSPIHAGWLGENLAASVFSAVSSFFQEVGSAITQTVSKILPNKSSPEQSLQTSCSPPVSPKPNVEQHAYGTMTITPEISQAREDNTITISLSTHINALAIQFSSLAGSSWLKDVIDWGPKQSELNEGKGIGITKLGLLQWDTFGYLDANKQPQKRPQLRAQRYWIKVKAPTKTVTNSSDQLGDNGGSSYGWKEINYKIFYVVGDTATDKDIKTVGGKDFFYVGGPQYPVGEIARIGSKTKSPGFALAETLVTVKAGEPFEIEARPTGWQGGTMMLELDPRSYTGRIIGSDTFQVKAGESAIWKVFPRGTSPVKGLISIKNNCNAFLGSTAFDAKGDYVRFEAGIKYDFKGLVKEKSELNFYGGVAHVLEFGKPDSVLNVTPGLSYMDDQVVVARVPDFVIELQAVYKDNPQELVKSIMITPRGKAQQAGSAAAVTNKDGKTFFQITAPNITKEEVSRGILLKATAPEISGLEFEQELRFKGIVIAITKPQAPKTPPIAPSPIPTPTPLPPPPANPEAPKAFPQTLLVSASKVTAELTEGDTVAFGAKLIMSDGSTQIATEKVVWTVIGKIGSVTPAGVFKAKLDESIAEYGEGFGFVTATYTDSTGNSFLGQSSMIRVKAFIPQEGELQGMLY